MARRKKKGLGPLYNPSAMLGGRKLKGAAKKLTKLEIGPQARSYERLAQQLAQQGQQVGTGLQALGDRTSGVVQNTYKNLATSVAENLARQKAIGETLQSRLAGVGSQAGQELGTQQGAALGSYIQGLGLKGAPGGGAAQQALAERAQAEQARQQQAAAAANQYGAMSAGAYNAYAAGQGAAQQQRGGESVAAIQRDIANRIAQGNLTTSQNVQEALGKATDIRALKGPTMLKNLLALREGERTFGLNQQAANLNAAKFQASLAQNAVENKRSKERNRTSRQNAKETKRHHQQMEQQGSTGTAPAPVDQSVIGSAIADAKARIGGGWPVPGSKGAKARAMFTHYVLTSEGVKPEWKNAVLKRIHQAFVKHGSL